MNYARMKKAELVTQLLMRDATLEARSATIIALQRDIDDRNARIADLEQALANVEAQTVSLMRDQRIVSTRAELLAKLRSLTREGVPCFMHGDFIKHRRTQAVIYQVQR